MTSSCSGLCSGSMVDEPKIVERNRTRQFARYEEIINVQPVIRLKSSGNKFIRELSGESKVVYKGFDGVTGKDIAWSKTVLTSENYERLYKEAKLLHSLDHENIINSYDCWVDFDNEFVTLNMITEFYSGNLRDYSKKHWIEMFQDTSPIINWCRHILKGLIYLHNLSPPIYLGSLYLEDLFVIGNSGTIKVGDLCSAIVLEPEGGTTESNAADAVAKARSEIYEFGICVLQMMSKDCVQRRWRDSHDRIKRVTDEELKEFIQKCIGDVDVRPTASELLNDPFLEPGFEDLGLYLTGCSLPDLRLSSVVEFPSSGSSDQRLRSVVQSERVVEKVITDEKGDKKLGLTGKVKDRELIHMNFVVYSGRWVKFYFSLETNTIHQVVKKIEVEFKLSAEDVLLVFNSMKELITEFLTEKSENDSKISAVISEGAPYILGMPTNGTSEGFQRIHGTSSVQHQVRKSENDSKISAGISEGAPYVLGMPTNGTYEGVRQTHETLSVQHQVRKSENDSKISAVISEGAPYVLGMPTNGTYEGVRQIHETSSVQHQVRTSSGTRQDRNGTEKKQEWQVVTGKKKKNRQQDTR